VFENEQLVYGYGAYQAQLRLSGRMPTGRAFFPTDGHRMVFISNSLIMYATLPALTVVSKQSRGITFCKLHILICFPL
jgi:hypothetical protein